MQPKFKGIEFESGGVTYVVPPLTLSDLEELEADIEFIYSLDPKARITREASQVFKKIVATAMRRNYPEITVEEVGNLLDLGNMPIIFPALMAQTGYHKAAVGEALAVPGNGSTGPTSTGPSRQLPGTATAKSGR